MSRIWITETEDIVREYFGKISYEDIANKVNEYLENVYKDKYKSWLTTYPGGVLYCAKRIGIITNDEYEEMVWEYKKDRSSYRKDAGHICLSLRNKIFDRDKKCLRCGATDNLTIDHIIPVIIGGKSYEDNLQTLCKSCNSWKNATVIDYRHPHDQKRKKHKSPIDTVERTC